MKNPELFQGNSKKKKYFEGWYFKMVAADGSAILSVIPGISISQDGKDKHAFIQVIDGKTAETFYYTFDINQFQFSKKRFAIRIDKNYFSEDKVILNIQNDRASFKGVIVMSNQVILTKKENKKIGIMGWYRFVPFMQCYHGVVSLNHGLNGTLKKDNKTYNFNKGKGYIEKDWGKSMPSAWIWMQSNSFKSSSASFMLSVANVPWVGNAFTGFLGFFHHDNITERFGTYSNAKLKVELRNSNSVKVTVSDKKYTYYIEINKTQSGLLKAPVEGSMDRRIAESIDAKMRLKVLDKMDKLIFQDSTNIAGLEMVGDLEKLIVDQD